MESPSLTAEAEQLRTQMTEGAYQLLLEVQAVCGPGWTLRYHLHMVVEPLFKRVLERRGESIYEWMLSRNDRDIDWRAQVEQLAEWMGLGPDAVLKQLLLSALQRGRAGYVPDLGTLGLMGFVSEPDWVDF